MGEHEPRHAVGERRLADAARAADQPGMRHASAAIGVEQRLLGLGMAEEDGGLARMRATQLDRRRRSLTMRRPSSASGAVAGIEPLVHRLPDAVGDGSASARWHRSITQRSGSALDELAIGLRAAPHGTRAPPPRTGRPSSSPRRLLSAREPDIRRHIEDEGEVGHEVADGHPFQRPDQFRIDMCRARPDRPCVESMKRSQITQRRAPAPARWWCGRDRRARQRTRSPRRPARAALARPTAARGG